MERSVARWRHTTFAKKMRRIDALFAECIRTFNTQDVDARAWFHRLDVETQRVETHTYVSYIPATVRPHVRTERGQPAYPDMYGFRLLVHPWRYLCPFDDVSALRTSTSTMGIYPTQ